MSRQLSEDDFARLSACLTDQVGLHFPRERWQDMERGIRSAARDFKFHDPKLCLEWLLSSPLSRRQVEVLASHLTVGETYFFREKPLFEVLEQRILPELIGSRPESGGRLRIWSAGCASGEEPYSIAIALNRTLGSESARKAMILATDINPRALEKAAAGVFGEWSFRDAPPRLKEMYFTRKDRHYEILRAIQQQVQFSFLNLAEDAYPSLPSNTNAMDIIFCRNVLMYFSPEQTRNVVRKFHRSLVDGGWLIVSPCEASAELFSEFVSQQFPGVILYQKRAMGTERAVEWTPKTARETFEPHAYCDFASLAAQSASLKMPSAEAGALQAAAPPASRVPLPALEEARTLYAEGCYTRAIEVLEEGENGQSADPAAHALAALSLANQGKLAEALTRCERAIEIEKVRAGHHYLRATILIEQGAWDEARQALKRALYLEPDFVPAHLALANLARQQGESDLSARHLEIAHRLLSARAREEILPESDGMTAGRLLEIIELQRGLRRSDGRHSPAQVKAGAPQGDSAHTRKGKAR